MNSKIATIGIFGVLLVAAFAGIVAVGDDANAEITETSTTTGYSVAYIVEGKTFTVPQAKGDGVVAGTIKLATLDELGAKAPSDKTFVAWNAAENGTGTSYVAGSTLIIPSDGDGKATLYAIFEWTTYTATFKDADGKDITTIKGTANTGGSGDAGVKDLAKVAPAAPAVEGMIFAGWLADGADAPVAKANLGKLSADVTYTAVYTVDYVVTFIDGDKTYVSCVSKLTVPDLGDRTGFTFLGWFIDTLQVDPETFPILEDTTFVAKWEPVNVYVTFTAGSFSTEVAVLYGQTVVEPALPSGYVGWGIEAEDGTVTAFDFSKAITEDMTIVGIAAAPAKATGLSDPIVMTLAIILGTLVLVGIAGLVVLKRQGKIVIGRGPNAAKNLPQEEKKE